MEWAALALAITGIVGAITQAVAKPYADKDPQNADAARAVEAGAIMTSIGTLGASAVATASKASGAAPSPTAGSAPAPPAGSVSV